jgi:hypothetical protein
MLARHQWVTMLAWQRPPQQQQQQQQSYTIKYLLNFAGISVTMLTHFLPAYNVCSACTLRYA